MKHFLYCFCTLIKICKLGTSDVTQNKVRHEIENIISSEKVSSGRILMTLQKIPKGPWKEKKLNFKCHLKVSRTCYVLSRENLSFSRNPGT